MVVANIVVGLVSVIVIVVTFVFLVVVVFVIACVVVVVVTCSIGSACILPWAIAVRTTINASVNNSSVFFFMINHIVAV